MPKYQIKVEDVTNPQSVKTLFTQVVESDVDRLRKFTMSVNSAVQEATAKGKPGQQQQQNPK